jgi:hypothetical protein
MRSVFGPVSVWSNAVLINWSIITLLYPVSAILLARRITPSRYLITTAMQICIVPAILLIFYALPSEFAVLKIEKPVNPGRRTPIHLILFDMLSYEFIFKNHRIDPEYHNLAALADSADVYINAYSPAGTTGQAVAYLTTGTDFENIGYRSNRWIVKKDVSNAKHYLSSYETLFSITRNHGYNVFLRAFALPYLNNFGEHVQSGKVYPFDTLWRVGMHSLIWPIINPGGLQHQKTSVDILNDYVTRIGTVPRNTFFYTHWNIPHDPFIYDSDGQMLGRIELTKNLITRPDRRLSYQYQLIGTDRTLGQIIEALKISETFEESLIIVTSDHNIAGYGFNMQHIPLIIKRPYQKASNTIDTKVTTHKLLSFIKYFIQEGECKNNILEKTI